MDVHSHPPLSPVSVLLARRSYLWVLGGLLAALAASAAIANAQVLLTWDEPIQRFVEANRTPFLDDFFLTVSRLGSTIPVLILGGFLSLLTWRRCPAVGLAVAAATISRPLLEFTIKALVDRSRPDFERMVNGTGPSFPSGHVMASVALWGLLPVVVAVYTQRRAIWWASVFISFTIIAGVSASRVYLGVHWFSDVIGGLVVGTFFLLGVQMLFDRTHGRYACRVCPDDLGKPVVVEMPFPLSGPAAAAVPVPVVREAPHVHRVTRLP